MKSEQVHNIGENIDKVSDELFELSQEMKSTFGKDVEVQHFVLKLKKIIKNLSNNLESLK